MNNLKNNTNSLDPKKDDYVLDDLGNYYCSKAVYESDSERRADGFKNGITLNIFDESTHTISDYAVSLNKHWYLR